METIPPDFTPLDASAATEAEPCPSTPGAQDAPPNNAGGAGYQPVRVEGTSMLPRLEDHDRLFINKFVYHFAAIARGDVVVFHYPRDPEKSYIKRVIAVPGDRLRIDHGVVWINGKRQVESYVPEEFQDTRSFAEVVIPEGSYFMMGDHRSISSDSREFGPVERSLIYGKAVFVYWPTRDAGVVR
jgi:signal peptidase I